MRLIVPMVLAAVALPLCACENPDAPKSPNNFRAALAQIDDAVRGGFDKPKVKAAAADVREAADKAGDKTEAAADKVGSELKEAGAELKAEATNAAD